MTRFFVIYFPLFPHVIDFLLVPHTSLHCFPLSRTFFNPSFVFFRALPSLAGLFPHAPEIRFFLLKRVFLFVFRGPIILSFLIPDDLVPPEPDGRPVRALPSEGRPCFLALK